MKINNVINDFLNDAEELFKYYGKCDSYVSEGGFSYVNEDKKNELKSRNSSKYANLYDRDEFISLYNSNKNIINDNILKDDDTAATLIEKRGLCANTNHSERYLPEPLSSSIYYERMNNTTIAARLMELEELASKAKKEAYECYSETCNNIDKIRNQLVYDTIFEYQTMAGMNRAANTIMCIITDKKDN